MEVVPCTHDLCFEHNYSKNHFFSHEIFSFYSKKKPLYIAWACFHNANLLVCLVDCEPSPDEVEVWTKIQGVLKEAQEILSGLHSYKGAADEIRKVSLRFVIVLYLDI